MLDSFKQKKDSYTLKQVLHELSQTEADVWLLTENNLSRHGIIEIIKAMSAVVLELRNELAEVHVGRISEFHVDVHIQTSLGKEVDENLQKLEELLQTQISLFQNILNMSKEEIENILNHGKTRDISRTSELIQDLIKILEAEIKIK